MIKTNDLDEYSFLNSMKSCCMNYDCVCDECPLNKICMFANLNISNLSLVYEVEPKTETKPFVMHSCHVLPKTMETVLLQCSNNSDEPTRKLAYLDDEGRWYEEYTGLLIPREKVKAWCPLPPFYEE
jgi:hypothetical protein